MSHDQNFKNLILDCPHQALAFFAVTEADAVGTARIARIARITPVRQEQFQERLGERFRKLDVPLLVHWPDGWRETLAFVLEEESDARRFSSRPKGTSKRIQAALPRLAMSISPRAVPCLGAFGGALRAQNRGY